MELFCWFRDLLGEYFYNVLSGVSLLLFWFFEIYRTETVGASVQEYKNGLNLLHLLEQERTTIQVLSGPSNILGMLMNKCQAMVNNQISQLETLASMYGIYTKKQNEIKALRDEIKIGFFKELNNFFVKNGANPAVGLSPQECKLLDDLWKQTSTKIKSDFQAKVFGEMLNLDAFDTTTKLSEFESQNRRFFYLTSALFILGSAIAWFSK